jgi:hypothetical protein
MIKSMRTIWFTIPVSDLAFGSVRRASVTRHVIV